MRPKNRSAAPPFESWRGLPKELPPVFYQISFNARVVALELYRHAPSYDGRIEITGAWDVALCRLIGVDSIARANTCRVFRKLAEVGALRVFDGFVIVWVGQSLDGLPTQTTIATQQPEGGHSIATEGPLNSRRGATQGPLDSRPQSSNCNDSFLATETDRQKEETEEKRTRARERDDLTGFNWYVAALGKLPTDCPALASFREQYAWIGSRPENERSAVAKAIAGDDWCQRNKHIVDPEHVRKRWQRYLGGSPVPVLKPVVATQREMLDEAQKAAGAAQREVNRLIDLPWFDKETAWYPKQLEAAQKAASAAHARLTELKSTNNVQAVAS